MWCPTCGGEFVGVEACPDCGATLVEQPPELSSTDIALMASAGRALGDVRLGVSILRVVAGLALVIWVLGVVAAMITTWDQVGPATGFGEPPSRLPTTLAVVLGSNSWGYLLVAVAAYGVSLTLQYRDAADTLAVLDAGESPT